MAEPLVQVEGLCCYFGAGAGLIARFAGDAAPPLRAADDINFQITAGETLSLVGESGCGKSTIARCVAGLQPLTGGSVRIAGHDTARIASGAAGRTKRRQTQMIFQDPYASLNPRWRVGRVLADPLRAFDPGLHGAALADRVSALLREVGLSPQDARKYPHEFSGGQRQRIAIARAIAASPDFIIADEPTSALDVSVQAQVLNLLRELQRKRRVTYLLISHNLAVVEHMSDSVGVMYLGRLVELRRAATLFEAPAHPYTKLLIETVPSLHRIGQRRSPPTGEVPDPRKPPTGCAFHPRCPLADARCRQERPMHSAVEGGTVACHAIQEGRAAAKRLC
jgi:peptide/nickel transport system ATP-binding protein